jgi:tetratricopeptide (TPR) repeat protein
MKKLLFIIIVLLVVTPVYAEDNNQQELINKGFDFIKSGNYQKAAEAFEIAVKANPNNADAHFGLGISYLKLGDNEVMTNPELVQKAVYFFRKALELGANYPEIRYTLGLSYLALNDKEAAIREYNILKDSDNELANQLLVRIDDYKPPKVYTRIGEIVSPLSLGERGIEESGVTVGSDQEARYEKCKKEAERGIGHPYGITRMSVKQRAKAEADYEQKKIDYIKSCMGYPTVVIDRETEERANEAERRAIETEGRAATAEGRARDAEQKARDAEHGARDFYDTGSRKWVHCPGGIFCY